MSQQKQKGLGCSGECHGMEWHKDLSSILKPCFKGSTCGERSLVLASDFLLDQR